MAYGQVVLDWVMPTNRAKTVTGVWHGGVVMPDLWWDVVELALVGAMAIWEDALPTVFSLQGFWYREVTGAPPYPPLTYVDMSQPGLNTNGMLPPVVAATVHFATGNLAVRRGHANMPPPAQEFCTPTQGAMHADAQGYYFNGWEAFRAVLDTENFAHAVLRLGTGVGQTIGANVQSYAVRPDFGTARTRKRGRGE